MSDKAPTTREPVTPNIIALAVRNADGTIRVTDVLCNKFPKLSRKQIATLSWKLSEFGRFPNGYIPSKPKAQL